MGTYSTWLDYVTDPSNLDAELILALQALDVVVDELYQADYIQFAYATFYAPTTQTVGAALREIGDALVGIASPTPVQVISIPAYGLTPIVDSASYAQLVIHKTGDLVTGQCYLSVAPSTVALIFNLLLNGVLVGTITYATGEHGYKEEDLSSISVVKGDVLELYCASADGVAAGLSMCLEY
jgi:hypothetical protein